MRLHRVCVFGILVACGASQSSTNITVNNVTNNINVDWGDEGRDDVNFQDARLARVLQELAVLVGHPVDLHFNVAMMPRPTAGFFDRLFERELGQIPRDLERMRDRSPEAFAWGAPRLTTIFFDYDGSARRPEVEHNPETGVVAIRMAGGVPGSAVSYALGESYVAALDSRYGGKNAEDVTEPEFASYFKWLESRGMRGDLNRRSRGLRNGAILWQRAASQPVVRASISTWLVGRVSFFTNQYNHHRDEIQQQRADAPFRAAERAWSVWIREAWPTLSDDQRRRLLDAMFMRRSGSGRAENPYLRSVFPNVDLFGLSFQTVDRWIASDYPRDGVFEFVLCPPRQQNGRMYDRGGRCDSDLYQWASTDENYRTRLFDEVLQRNDVRLTEALFANLKWRSNPYIMEAWRHFESNLAQWNAATRVLAELIDYSRQDLRNELYDDAARLWRESPDKRGSLLYLLAAMSHPRSSRSGLVRWEEFRRVFGGTVGASEFGAFLAHGEGAVLRASVVWPARGRAALFPTLQPHLEEAMNNPEIHSRHHHFPHRTLRE
ncbi:MAG: hypothetical protein AAGE52_43015, partial [Myxococcota bacterium]